MSSHPDCFDTLLAAWNERDPARLRQKVDQALTEDVSFTDPHYDIRGKAAFVAMVEEFFRKYGDVKLVRTSAIDMHHDRARYSWCVVWPDGRRFDGFDAVALDKAAKQIRRIDGFFGPLKPSSG